MATMPYTVENKIYRTHDYAYALQIGSGTNAPYVYGTLESFGKLLYKMGESVYLYTDIDMRQRGIVVDPDSIAYEVFCAMATMHGNRRGRKPSCGVYLVDSNTGEVIKHYRF